MRVHKNLAATAAAVFRDLRDNPTFAYATQRSASGFLSAARLLGHAYYKTRAAFTFSACSSPLQGEKGKSVILPFSYLFGATESC